MIVKIKVGIRRRSRFSYKFRANWSIFSILRTYFRGGRMSLRMRSVPSKYNKKRTYASKVRKYLAKKIDLSISYGIYHSFKLALE